MADKDVIQSPAGEFVMFASDDGTIRITCRFEHETLWLSQAAIATLYQVTPLAITQHIKAIYDEGELEQKATCKAYLQVQQEGQLMAQRADATQPHMGLTRYQGEKDIVGLLQWDKKAKR